VKKASLGLHPLRPRRQSCMQHTFSLASGTQCSFAEEQSTQCQATEIKSARKYCSPQVVQMTTANYN